MPRKEKLPTSLFLDDEIDFQVNKDADLYSLSQPELRKKMLAEKECVEKLISTKNYIAKRLNELFEIKSKYLNQIWTTKSKYWIMLRVDESKNMQSLHEFLVTIDLDFILDHQNNG